MRVDFKHDFCNWFDLDITLESRLEASLVFDDNIVKEFRLIFTAFHNDLIFRYLQMKETSSRNNRLRKVMGSWWIWSFWKMPEETKARTAKRRQAKIKSGKAAVGEHFHVICSQSLANWTQHIEFSKFESQHSFTQKHRFFHHCNTSSSSFYTPNKQS